MFDTTKLSKRDAYFVGYANAYEHSIEQMTRENAEWQKIVDKWPNGDAIPELKQRIAFNNSRISQLKNKIRRILANVRR